MKKEKSAKQCKQEKKTKDKPRIKSAKNEKKKAKTTEQMLAYPIPIRVEGKEKLVETLHLCKKYANKYLKVAYNEEAMAMLQEGENKAYKELEPLIKGENDKKLHSRINRGILEIVGRTLRSIGARKNLFEVLCEHFPEEEKWDYRKLIEEKDIYVKSQWVENLKEQAINYKEKEGEPTTDFFALQPCPEIHTPMLSYAPDDGRAIKISQQKTSVDIEIRVIEDPKAEKLQYQWLKFSLDLPKQLQDKAIASPDLRLDCIHGQWLPVLDFKIKQPCQQYEKTDYFLTIDWGVNKLVTLCIFDRQGNQITTPIFLKFTPLRRKLSAIRKEIDFIKSKRDKLPKDSPQVKEYNREIARKWRKYRAIQEALSHLASSLIVYTAKLFGASSIYCEWLKGLKSTDRSPDVNWWINTTVRQAIFDKVAYKAKLHGLIFHKPVNPYGLSQFCPRCGHKGFHIKASNNPKKSKSGAWFVCPSCHFNADRDYVSTINLARKVLFGNSLKNSSKGIFYMKSASPVLLFRQGNHAYLSLITRLIRGWKKSISLRSHFFSGTLIS